MPAGWRMRQKYSVALILRDPDSHGEWIVRAGIVPSYLLPRRQRVPGILDIARN